MKALVSLVSLLACACGAKVGGGGDAGGAPHEDVHAEDVAAPRDTGSTKDVAEPTKDAGIDCGQPEEPTYACSPGGSADAGFCYPYGEDAGVTYPLNCMVTLPTCDTAFGGAQTCNCQVFPGMGPTWICPL
jgi:hypothetical protein